MTSRGERTTRSPTARRAIGARRAAIAAGARHGAVATAAASRRTTIALRGAGWFGAVVLIVLAARALAYALSASPQAPVLQRAAGGPGVPVIALVCGILGLGGACAVLWLAALGVRERRLLEGRPLEREPRLRLKTVLPRAAALFVISSLAFALLESTIHWRAGLGWHGLSCLVGPVHRDAIPILGALAVVAAALAAALEHVLAWMRRTLAALTAKRRAGVCRTPPVRPRHATPFTRDHARTRGARGPPLVA